MSFGLTTRASICLSGRGEPSKPSCCRAMRASSWSWSALEWASLGQFTSVWRGWMVACTPLSALADPWQALPMSESALCRVCARIRSVHLFYCSWIDQIYPWLFFLFLFFFFTSSQAVGSKGSVCACCSWAPPTCCSLLFSMGRRRSHDYSEWILWWLVSAYCQSF